MKRNVYNVGPRREWKCEEFDGLKPTVYDWVRVAAFLDGEGHLSISGTYTRKGKPRFQQRVIVSNTNPALPLWLKETFGGNIVLRNSQKYNPKSKQSYIYSCNAARCAWILYNCQSWLLLKQSQAKILMEMQEQVDNTRQGRGRSVSDESQAYRTWLKSELHKLNAKGCDAQERILTPEELGQTRRG